MQTVQMQKNSTVPKTEDDSFIPSSKIVEISNGKAKICITESPLGKRYKNPVLTWTPLNLSNGEQNVYMYVWESLSPSTPSIIPFAFENASVLKLAKYISRNRSGSRKTCNYYIYMVARFSGWAEIKPDILVSGCKDSEGLIDPRALAKTTQLLDDYIGELKARNLADKTISDHAKAVKCFFMVNGITITLPYRLSNRRTYKDRAPTAEELQKLVDIGNIREKAIVSMLALGGFREGTLSSLLYRHVKRDLERGIVPVHIHIEAAITKGKYADYDTFLGAEAANYIKAYLDLRRHGSPCGKIPPETITDDSPLIRADHGRIPKAVDGKAIYRAVHSLYLKANMLMPLRGRRYDLCAHSTRKFFRTQLAALGTPTEYIEYMMGHTLSTYHDIEMKGIEFLRNIYAASGLSIRPKTQLSKIETLKELIRAWGMNPEQLLTREALTAPNRTTIDGNLTQEQHVETLSSALRDIMKKELLSIKAGA